MRNPDSHFIVPALHDGLFPQRQFPPYLALEAVRRSIDAVLARHHPQTPDLDRLQARVAAIAQRLISLAQGQLRLFRWYRRIAVSVQLCQRGRGTLAEYVRTGAMTELEAATIDRQLADVIERLRDLLARPELTRDGADLLPSGPARPDESP